MANKNLYNYEEEKTKKKRRKKKNKKIEKPSSHIDPDNEIIIGVTVHPEKNTKTSKTKKNNKYNTQPVRKNVPVKKKKTHIAKQVEEKKNKPTINIDNKSANYKYKAIIGRTSVVALIVGIIIFALVSPIFNIQNIKVTGNNKLEKEKIIGMTGVELGQNIFKINKKEIRKNIEKNGYINSVNIKRNLPDEIEIIVSERIPSFAIEYGNGYVIIGSQGYIIEVAEEKKSLPLLIGMTTKEENYKENNRLEEQDLNKLNLILKIMNAASISGIETLISSIDVSEINNVKINLETEGKIAYLGDCSNLSHRMQWIKTILENRQRIDGEIIVDMDLNTKDPYFRESLQ